MNYGEALVGLPITFAYVINCLIDTAAAYGDIRPGFRYSLYDVGNDVGITFVTAVLRVMNSIPKIGQPNKAPGL